MLEVLPPYGAGCELFFVNFHFHPSKGRKGRLQGFILPTYQGVKTTSASGTQNGFRSIAFQGYTDTTAAKTLQQANAYTDMKFDQLGGRINALDSRISEVEKAANRGIAASLAMQQTPAAIGPGESAVTAGVGGYGGQSAIAVGVHHVTKRNIMISGGVAASPNGGPVAYRMGGSFKF